MLCDGQIELYTLYGSENRLVKPLQASNTLGSGQNVLFKLLQASYMLSGCQKTLRASTRLIDLCVGKYELYKNL